ncbi:hypothetical protein SteCoe_27496 [Stentor coeruleus]|uniref:CAP-Gly domain-containing protein n=1 Tax=Stentor coeruleus TaxID=5963 RepID=A0A1R2BAF0_9CILI|nr:hypothetical protein SteCoe_27496 [Stentor coeruleus]
MESTTVKLNVTHSKRSMKALELRFSTASTIESVKNNLEMRFGTSANFMMLKLVDTAGNTVASMLDNESKLGFYNPQDFYTIHIVDLDPSTVDLDNVENVDKYEISEEAYNALDVNFRKFKEEMKKSNPDLMKPNKPQVDDEHQADLIGDISVGNRCRINPGDKRGTVRFVGKIQTLNPGYWIGIELDEPLGKNDGSHSGNKYFECTPKHGIFVRPSAVEVGNFRPYDEDPDEI